MPQAEEMGWVQAARREAGDYFLWAVIFGAGAAAGGLIQELWALALPVALITFLGLKRKSHRYLLLFWLGIGTLGYGTVIAVGVVLATIPLFLISFLPWFKSRPSVFVFITTLLLQLPTFFVAERELRESWDIDWGLLLWVYWLVGLLHLDAGVKEGLQTAFATLKSDGFQTEEMSRRLAFCLLPALVASTCWLFLEGSAAKFQATNWTYLLLVLFIPFLGLLKGVTLSRLPLGDQGRVVLGFLLLALLFGVQRTVLLSSFLLTTALAPKLISSPPARRRAFLGWMVVTWGVMSYVCYFILQDAQPSPGINLVTLSITAWMNLCLLHGMMHGGQRLLAVWVAFLRCLQEPWTRMLEHLDGKGPNFDE